ncbi:60S ribosomal protein L18 [Parelaphostrongylus tenuis]|uniref:Large ribosomal subunit protein eL18 n=1 Tax=Parelaphostrongylus tenuis TaxID=148309 RepID=A0AAD5MX69_PARTN|nr:60S ribosomal protein L18 [Parelaphostrongylus tenuis]
MRKNADVKAIPCSSIYCSYQSILRKSNNANKIVVTCSTVTDDARLYEVPKFTLAALKVTESARARILKTGGLVITLDHLALRAPKGEKHSSSSRPS